MGYNGWTNYETWNVALWLDNEQGSYSECQSQAEEFIRDNFDASDPTDTSAAKGDMSTWLKDMVNEQAPDLGASCFADLLGAALGEVDWYEIASHYIDDKASDVVSELIRESV